MNNERLETYTMTPEEEIKYLRKCVRELQEKNEHNTIVRNRKTLTLDDNSLIYLLHLESIVKRTKEILEEYDD